MTDDRLETLADNSPGAGRSWTRLTSAVLLAISVLVYLRLYFGVDVTDESFYNALPYSFVLGFRPYHEELNITQNAGILLAPLFKLYCSLSGSSHGLVLFNRHLYFVLLAACSGLAYRVGQTYLNANGGRMLAAFALTFSYFNIPSLSYNTLGAFFLFGGLFQLLLYGDPDRESRSPGHIFGANVCFLLSAFCYPTLVLSSGTGFGVSYWLAARGRSAPNAVTLRNGRIAWWGSAGVGLAGVVGFLAFAGVSGVRDALMYAGTYGYAPGDSAARMVQLLQGQLRQLAVYLIGFAALLALPVVPVPAARKHGRLFVAVTGGVAAGILYLIHRQPSWSTFPAGSEPLLLCFGLLLPVVLFLVPDRRQAQVMALVVLLPSGVAAIATSVSSLNGLPAAVLGLFPAAVGCLLSVGLAAAGRDRSAESNGSRVAAFLVVLIPVLALQVCSLLERSYRDAPFAPGADPTFASGPFAGLLTTNANARRLAALDRDLNSPGNTGQTLFVYDRFPAAYLMAPLRPRTFSTWIFWPADPAIRSRLLQRAFGGGAPPPDAILQIGPRPTWVDAEIRRLNYKVLIARPEYDYVLWLRERD